jgi:hypothetical protein
MVSLADIKKDLPEWPDDVIEQWLLYFARQRFAARKLRQIRATTRQRSSA